MKRSNDCNAIPVITTAVRLPRMMKRHIRLSRLPDPAVLSAEMARTIDSCFVASAGETLKDDHFSTVIRIPVDTARVVIKKENPGIGLRFLRKSLRPSRAARTWRNGLFLAARGLRSIVPLALIEDRLFFFRVRSFLVSADISGPLLNHFLARPDISEARKTELALALIRMVGDWHRQGVTHGDPKASNIIVGDAGLYLIDPEDARCHRLNGLRKRAMARDWSIVLHNWQNDLPIRQIMLPHVLSLVADRRHHFAGRLIRKFWKTEYDAAGWSPAEEAGAFGRVINELAAGKTPGGWQRSRSRGDRIDAFCPETAVWCVVSPRAFIGLNQVTHYFQKRRLPRRGILSMALSLRICGFFLPRIHAAGLRAGYEYLVLDKTGQASFVSVWETLPSACAEKRERLLQRLGAEIGRFHAMGFLHGEFDLNHIGVTVAEEEYCVFLALHSGLRRPRRITVRQTNRDMQTLNRQLGALLSEREQNIFRTAYKKERHRQ